MANHNTTPSLKSASGAGFSFEDNVAALILCEMLTGHHSLGNELGVVRQLERQAGDWEPFGDLLLTVPNRDGKLVRVGCSVKSNRQLNTNGCDEALRAGLWKTFAKPMFVPSEDLLGVFCARLSGEVSQHLHSLCRQARENEPARLDTKIVHSGLRQVYQSFGHPMATGPDSLPGRVLSRLVPREFDFEETTSRDEADAVRLCHEVLKPDVVTAAAATDLWSELLRIAESLRIAGGAITRGQLTARFRSKFRLRDDPCDASAWTRIREFTRDWMEEVELTLTGGLVLPRTAEIKSLRTKLSKNRALHLLGESGSGKSGLVKMLAADWVATGAEILCIKAERFTQLHTAVPDFVEVAQRVRSESAFLVFDSLDGCYTPEALAAIARVVAAITGVDESPWQVILVCQPFEWSRVSQCLVKELAGHPALTQRVECGELSPEDLALVCAASPSVARLAKHSHLKRVLTSPKMLDVLLGGQAAEDRVLAGEADLVEWWWEHQVRGPKPLAAEERVARQLAARMADELTTELPPDAAAGAEEAASTLVRKRVLSRTRDGRLRFDHDLLADWSRVMHLRSLGHAALAFMRVHTENPPWLRAIRLLSQHLLDRTGDLERWRTVVAECSAAPKDQEEPSAESLQVLDAWLEGIVYSANPARILDDVKADLFANGGRLLRRLTRRLLHVGTEPDPVVQRNCVDLGAETAEVAGRLYRLPLAPIWMPLLRFLLSHPEESTDYLPIEIAEIAGMWARIEQYWRLSWLEIADLSLLNAEKELRREVAGEHRSDRGLHGSDGNKSRVSIYAGALHASSQRPERATKLLLKAAGRGPWEEGDVADDAHEGWRGERSKSMSTQVIFEDDTESPPSSWPDGPRRRISTDFFHAWFDSGTARALYRHNPQSACEATLAFLLEWPKSKVFRGAHGPAADRHGFNYEADNMDAPFWSTGPFLLFLRENWPPALDLIVKLVNFATERYSQWWPYDPPVSGMKFPPPHTARVWQGNHQVYRWNRFNMNTPDVVSCVLMALEKWLDEKLEGNDSVTDVIDFLYTQGQSLAFAGVLISIGKRHPDLFPRELKPLLFIRGLYLLDMQSVMESVACSAWRESESIRKLRHEWNNLPGRKTNLLDACCQWLLTKPEFVPILAEVSAVWRQEAEGYPADSEDRLSLLRWASDFDRSTWKEVTLSNGQKVWHQDRPQELRNQAQELEADLSYTLLTLPMRCQERLEKRQQLADAEAQDIWKRLQNWGEFEKLKDTPEEDEWASMFRDHRHAKAGLLALLFCLGEKWLLNNSDIRAIAESEVCKLLADPPKVCSFTPEEIHDDGEGFLGRCIIRCWSENPSNTEWRVGAAQTVTAYRYRTVQSVFEEAFCVRTKLGAAYREFQALALSFAVARELGNRESRREGQSQCELEWAEKWIPAFADCRGPALPDAWASIEAPDRFPLEGDDLPGVPARRQLGRRNYGFDIGVVLAVFGHFPALATAHDATERGEWVKATKELLASFLRTLPTVSTDTQAERGYGDSGYDVWDVDHKIFDIVAARLLECKPYERTQFWQPILSLPPAACHHINQFLSAVLLEAIRTEPSRIPQLLPIWREMAEYLFASATWTSGSERGQRDVWRHVFLYGTAFSSIGDEDFIEFVNGLRSLFERHVKTLGHDPYAQASFAGYLTTKAGECLLVDALVWLRQSWEQASDWFWKTAIERSSHFASLLEHAWHKHMPAIRVNADALKAFKTLTLKLATHQVPIALEVQSQIGSAGGY
jgi:hypothetical protein